MVQENTSTKTDADQECDDNESEATSSRKTPDNSHSGEKEIFTPLLDYCNSCHKVVPNTWHEELERICGYLGCGHLYITVLLHI